MKYFRKKEIGKKMKKNKTSLLLGLLLLGLAILFPVNAFAEESETQGMELKMTPFIGNSFTGEEFDDYVTAYQIPVTTARTKTGQYGNSVVANLLTMDSSTHWETGSQGSATNRNWVDITLAEEASVGRLVYGSRISPLKGFPTRYRIWASLEEAPNINSPAEGTEGWFYVGEGTGKETTAFQEIVFDEEVTARTFRFEWIGWYNTGWSAARTLLPFKSDTIRKDILSLFTDGSCTALKNDVTKEQIDALEPRVDDYIYPDDLRPYLETARMLISGVNTTDRYHEPMVLSQRGDRGSERSRTDTGMTLASYDLSGYYVHPGETISVYVNADSNSRMPRIVFATVARSPWAWYQGYDGVELKNGLNTFTIPETQNDCYAIYFYNPALPAEQGFAPVVRLVGGTPYPVYRYDPKDSYEVTKKKEAEYLAFLDEYLEGVSDTLADQLSGNAHPNIAEYVSDKILISVSARGAKKAATQTTTWSQGKWREFTDTVRFGTVTEQGIAYTGPAAAMEAYEMLFDDIQYYSGFNITNPAHSDYRNHGQFLFRAYNDGAGLGWGQSVYSGYNTGSRPDGDRLDNSFYVDIATPATVLQAGWAIYHEIGHVFDNGSIGTSESTNNLYCLYAGIKYLGENRLDFASENRWWNHFTSYINTGILPQNDLLFYPGAVIWQLDAVDFSKTCLYQNREDGDHLLSNYGMACRYAREHRSDLSGLDKDSKTVVCFSMACGVDLSDHFEYYGRTISDRARFMIAGLPKEPRPTWYTNDRTFRHTAFTQEEKNAAWSVTASIDEATGAVTITAPAIGTVFSDANFQCYEIYKTELDQAGNPVGESQFVGITGNNKQSRVKNELYTFTDKKVVPGTSYEYSVKAYDSTLETANHVAKVKVGVEANVEIPVERILINTGDEGKSFNVGQTYAVALNYFPETATANLKEINWWIEGWGRDGGHTGGAEDIIVMTDDPNFPGDPTRKLLTGVQPGQTHLYVRLGNLTQSHRIVINGTINLTAGAYTYNFKDNSIDLAVEELVQPKLLRTTAIDESPDHTPKNTQVVVRTYPNTIGFRSKNPEIATVSDAGIVYGVKAGTTTVEFYRKATDTVAEEVLATLNVRVHGEEIPATAIEISNAPSSAMNSGDTVQLNYRFLPETNTENRRVLWSSDNIAVARVDSNGFMTAVSGGTAAITAKIEGTTIQSSVEISVAESVALQRLSIDKKTMTLTDGSPTGTLQASKIPADAQAFGTINWVSSNTNVATVASTEEGRATVTAVGSGKCNISAVLDGKIISCSVTVEKPIELTGAKFVNRGNDTTETSATLNAGNTIQFSVLPEPLTATGLNAVQWTSNDEKIATVKQGLVTAVAEGTTTITATFTQPATGKSASVTATIEVTENVIPLTGIGLNRGSLTMSLGEDIVLQANLRPVNANDLEGEVVQWESSNPKVATVDFHGNVLAKSVGNCTITASLKDFTATCEVHVKEDVLPAEAVEISPTSLGFVLPCEGERLTATVYPAEAITSVFWSVSGTQGIVTVNQNGLVTPIAEGETRVRATAAGGKYTEIPVIVTIHDHTYADTYSTNDTHHWYPCTVTNCPASPSALRGYGEHQWAENASITAALKSEATILSPAIYYKTCSVCGKISTTETFEYGEVIPHDHEFEKIVTEEAKISEATISSPAMYWKSCKHCGVLSETETFEHGDPLPHEHVYEDVYQSDETHQTHHWRACLIEGCPTEIEDLDSYEPHNYEEIVDPTALKSEATTTSPAIYYMGCICGTLSEDTFEYGEPLSHEHRFEADYSKSSTHHWRACTAVGCDTPVTALENYERHYFKDVVKAEALYAKATTASPALYYKSCVCGALSTETFTYGEKLPGGNTDGGNGNTGSGNTSGGNNTSGSGNTSGGNNTSGSGNSSGGDTGSGSGNTGSGNTSGGNNTSGSGNTSGGNTNSGSGNTSGGNNTSENGNTSGGNSNSGSTNAGNTNTNTIIVQDNTVIEIPMISNDFVIDIAPFVVIDSTVGNTVSPTTNQNATTTNQNTTTTDPNRYSSSSGNNNSSGNSSSNVTNSKQQTNADNSSTSKKKRTQTADSEQITEKKEPTTLLEKVQTVRKNRSLTTSYPENETIGADIFAALQEKEANLHIVEPGKVEWLLHGKDIDKPDIALDLGVDIFTRGEVEQKELDTLLYNVLGEKKAVVVNFAHEGPLPGKATVRVPLTRDQKEYLENTVLDVYHVNEEEESLEEIAMECPIGEDSFVEFSIRECSPYVLVSRVQPVMQEEPVQEPQEMAQTTPEVPIVESTNLGTLEELDKGPLATALSLFEDNPILVFIPAILLIGTLIALLVFMIIKRKKAE